jgi:hypothetical protein
MSIEMYQTGVLGPHQIVDYASTVMQAYPPEAVQSEPFVGFKVLVKDRVAATQHPRIRLEYLDRVLQQILPYSGCIVREATIEEMPDKTGLWVITMPVPRSQIIMQIRNLMGVLQKLEQVSVFLAGQFEVNVSGRCTPMDTESRLGTIYIPPAYANMIINPLNTPYKFGHIKRINEYYMCLRTRWNSGGRPVAELENDMIVLSNSLSTIYH